MGACCDHAAVYLFFSTMQNHTNVRAHSSRAVTQDVQLSEEDDNAARTLLDFRVAFREQKRKADTDQASSGVKRGCTASVESEAVVVDDDERGIVLHIRPVPHALPNDDPIVISDDEMPLATAGPAAIVPDKQGANEGTGPVVVAPVPITHTLDSRLMIKALKAPASAGQEWSYAYVFSKPSGSSEWYLSMEMNSNHLRTDGSYPELKVDLIGSSLSTAGVRDKMWDKLKSTGMLLCFDLPTDVLTQWNKYKKLGSDIGNSILVVKSPGGRFLNLPFPFEDHGIRCIEVDPDKRAAAAIKCGVSTEAFAATLALISTRAIERREEGVVLWRDMSRVAGLLPDDGSLDWVKAHLTLPEMRDELYHEVHCQMNKMKDDIYGHLYVRRRDIDRVDREVRTTSLNAVVFAGTFAQSRGLASEVVDDLMARDVIPSNRSRSARKHAETLVWITVMQQVALKRHHDKPTVQSINRFLWTIFDVLHAPDEFLNHPEAHIALYDFLDDGSNFNIHDKSMRDVASALARFFGELYLTRRMQRGGV